MVVGPAGGAGLLPFPLLRRDLFFERQTMTNKQKYLLLDGLPVFCIDGLSDEETRLLIELLEDDEPLNKGLLTAFDSSESDAKSLILVRQRWENLTPYRDPLGARIIASDLSDGLYRYFRTNVVAAVFAKRIEELRTEMNLKSPTPSDDKVMSAVLDAELHQGGCTQSYTVEDLDLRAIGNIALALAATGQKMPPKDAYEVVVGSWQIEMSNELTKLERLLNPKRFPFGDDRRIHFPGPSGQSRALLRLRDSVDRILKVLRFEEVAHKEYSRGESEDLRGPMANHPRMEERHLIKPEEWQRIEDEGRTLLQQIKETHEGNGLGEEDQDGDKHGKRKRGTKKTKSRKIDVAITLVIRNPELDDAEIARRAHCDRSYLTRSREYQNHAEMARRAMVRQQKHSQYDARSRQVHPTAEDDC